MDTINSDQPIINCHTHIFTGDHVPPYLAKTFIPLYLYYLLPVRLFIGAIRFYFRKIDPIKYKSWYKWVVNRIYHYKMVINRNGILNIVFFAISVFLTVQVFFILVDWLISLHLFDDSVKQKIVDLRLWFINKKLLYIPPTLSGKLLLTLLFFLLFKSGRNFVIFLIKKTWSLLGVLPGPESKKLLGRYMNIFHFSKYLKQETVFDKLKNQYPDDTAFVVLPMDMEYMGAGKLKKKYRFHHQMEEIKEIKRKEEYRKIIYPFVFADPRRMQKEGKNFFDYSIEGKKIVLKDCFIKTYLEEENFSGIKIYPALGYYPFDEELLPLWKYAADNHIPIITHCIKGTIYYRGKKKKEWDAHPVFEGSKGDGKYAPLKLTQMKNSDYCNNFTHPMNYLCLLNEELLKKLIAKSQNDCLKELFGYTCSKKPLASNLSQLKICFAHFGGDDQWNNFLESDRDNYSTQLIKNPTRGLEFFTNNEGEDRRGKPEQIWKYVDWYTIICSIMLQYENVYADISYILHDQSFQVLLKKTLSNEMLLKKVLFGTDFYVVRNHKSEKNILADMQFWLNEAEYNQIARVNPRTFLNNKIHGPVKI